jgi:hypothetical protein
MESGPDELYRVPVRRVPVTLTLVDGSRREAILFVGEEESVASPLRGGREFLPVDELGVVRLYAASALACISASEAPEERHPSERVRQVRVRMKSGATFEGEVRFIPAAGKSRLIDALAEEARTIVLHEHGAVHHVDKAHVLFVEELA